MLSYTHKGSYLYNCQVVLVRIQHLAGAHTGPGTWVRDNMNAQAPGAAFWKSLFVPQSDSVIGFFEVPKTENQEVLKDIWGFLKIVGFPPKSSILIGFSIIFTVHFGVFLPIFGVPPICLSGVDSHAFPSSVVSIFEVACHGHPSRLGHRDG